MGIHSYHLGMNGFGDLVRIERENGSFNQFISNRLMKNFVRNF